MHESKIVKVLIGTEQVVLDDLYHEADQDQFVLRVHPSRIAAWRCPICGRKAKKYDSGRGVRRWRSVDLGGQKVFVEAETPRVCCKKHGVLVAAVPWARHDSGFTRNFEETTCWLSVYSSQSVVSQFMRIDWHSVGRISGRIYKELEAAAPSQFDGLVNIGIDETSYKKGHKYITVVVNHDSNSVVWCAEGYGKNVLKRFFEQLTLVQRASIRCVTADGARWIASCIKEYCPNAERCIDPFHVVSWATEVLDKERRKAWIEAEHEVRQKRGRGRPMKEETVLKKELRKDTKYPLLKNPENLTERQQAQLELIAISNPRLYRAYRLKEGLRLALKLDGDHIGDALIEWMAWAQRCRIPAFVELRAKIKRHFDAIVATAKYKLSNARIEATNNKIKLTIKMAYGFRNTDNLLSWVMLRCSAVHPKLPGRA